jgi:transcriptional regulator with XRE-family HTH domain
MKQGDYIRLLFKERGLKIKEVAKQLNIAPNTLSLKIANKRKFKPDEINFLLEILNLPYEDIFKASYMKITDNDKCNVIVFGQKFEVSKTTANEIISIINNKEVVCR